MTNCKVCCSEAKQKCSGCLQVFYCSKNCQISDWKNGHKSDCKPYEVNKSLRDEFWAALSIKSVDTRQFEITVQVWCFCLIYKTKTWTYFSCHQQTVLSKKGTEHDFSSFHFLSKVKKNDKLGRYMVAARDLKAGEVLFREVAVVHGPKMLSHPICLGCHKALSPKSPKTSFYRCSSCSWPLCSKLCENLAPHVEECKLMAATKHYKCPIKTNVSATSSEIVYWVFPLRFLLLKRKQPKMWGICRVIYWPRFPPRHHCMNVSGISILALRKLCRSWKATWTSELARVAMMRWTNISFHSCSNF